MSTSSQPPDEGESIKSAAIELAQHISSLPDIFVNNLLLPYFASFLHSSSQGDFFNCEEACHSLSQASHEELQALLQLSSGGPGAQQTMEALTQSGASEKALCSAAVVLRALHLRLMLQHGTCFQLLSLLPEHEPVAAQIVLLRSLRDLSSRLGLNDARRVRQVVLAAPASERRGTLTQTLELAADYAFLYNSLLLLFELEMDDFDAVFNELASLDNIHIEHLANLSQLSDSCIRNIASALSCDSTSVLEERAQAQGAVASSTAHASAVLRVSQQPDRSVSKRNIKPAPVILVSENVEYDKSTESLVLCVRLFRQVGAVEEEVPDLMVGGDAQPCFPGVEATFKKIKVQTTSRMSGDAVFVLQFDLYAVHRRSKTKRLISTVRCAPVIIVSHASQLKPNASTNMAKVTEVIPERGPPGTRVCVLGRDFARTPTLRVRFGGDDVMALVHESGTLLCYVPAHLPLGNCEVRVSNNGRDFSASYGEFQCVDGQSAAVLNQQQQRAMESAHRAAAEVAMASSASAMQMSSANITSEEVDNFLQRSSSM